MKIVQTHIVPQMKFMKTVLTNLTNTAPHQMLSVTKIKMDCSKLYAREATHMVMDFLLLLQLCWQ